MTPTARTAVSALIVAVAAALTALVPLLPELGGPSVDDGFVVDRLDRTVEVRSDGRAEVTEVVEVTFLEERRGIFRDLEATGLGGAASDHVVHEVDRGAGTDPWPYVLEDEGDLDRIRVGDEDVVLDPGPQTYRFRYDASAQVALDEAAPDTVELRIDAPGASWPVEVGATSVRVEVPSEPVTVTCVYGEQGATTPCPDAEVVGTTVTQHVPALEPATTGTLSVRLPASAFDVDSLPSASFTSLEDGDGQDEQDEPPPLELPVPWSGLALGLAAAVPLAGFELLRARFVYRDRVTDRVRHHRVTPTAELAPPDGLSPNELAAVLQRIGDDQDRLLATMIGLELRDVLRSHATTEDGAELDRTRVADDGGDAPSVERIVLVPGAHPERATDLEATFVDALLGETGSIAFDGEYDPDTSKRVEAASRVLDEHAEELRRPGGGLVHDRGMALRGWRGGVVGALAIVASFALAWGASQLLGLAWYLALPVLGVVAVAWVLLASVWRYQRQAFTSYGRDLSRRTRAFRHFLAEVHRDRLAVDAELGTPLRHPIVAMLPFAVALGLGDSWYERFAPVLSEVSATDPSMGAAGGVPWWGYAAGFAGVRTAQSGSTTSPSSGGGAVGGGAGSGAGGGGGGSW